MIEDRQYQGEGRYFCNRQLNQGNHPLIVMGAGTGKTKMSILIIKDRILLGKKLIVVVPQLEIFDQWIKECGENNINYGYINDEGIVGINKDVYICMYQSLSLIISLLPERFCKNFNEIIIDECHHSGAESYETIYNHFHWCLRMGLTASPYRKDNKPLGKYFTHLFEPIKTSEAIEKGYLCRPIIIIPDEYQNYVPSTKDEIENINISKQKKFVQEKKIIGDMVQVYKDIFDGLPVIVPCGSYKHAILVHEMYENAGWNVDHIHSNLNKTERKMIINRVKKGKTNILITVGIGIEGLDIPGLMGIIWLRFTESLQIWIQFNGRAARIMEGKKYYVLVDPVGNSVIHGKPDVDREWSLENDYVPDENNSEVDLFKVCPVCSNVNSAENLHCWICNYDFIAMTLDGVPIAKVERRLPKIVNGELVFLDKEFDGGNDGNNTNNNTVHNGSDAIPEVSEPLTKAEKQEILSRDLTGLRLKTKFREGIKSL